MLKRSLPFVIGVVIGILLPHSNWVWWWSRPAQSNWWSRPAQSNNNTCNAAVRVEAAKVSIAWSGLFFGCYGHYLIDTVYPLFLYLRQEFGAHIPVIDELVLVDRFGNSPVKDIPNAVFDIVTLTHMPVPAQQYDNARLLNNDGSLVPTTHNFQFYASDHHGAFIWKWLTRFAQTFPNQTAIQRNDHFRYGSISVGLEQYRMRIVKRLGLEKEQRNEKLVTISFRTSGRVARGIDTAPYRAIFAGAGLELELVNFSGMSLRDQVKQMLRTKYFVGVYGSNLANALSASWKCVAD
jgi:hypothetical protein